MFKIVNPILSVPSTNAVSDKSGLKLSNIKTYLHLSISQKHLFFLVFATYENKFDELKILEVINQFCFKNIYLFFLKLQLGGLKYHTKCVDYNRNLEMFIICHFMTYFVNKLLWWKNSWFVQSCLMSQSFNLDLVLNQVASNAIEIAHFQKGLPSKYKKSCKVSRKLKIKPLKGHE